MFWRYEEWGNAIAIQMIAIIIAIIMGKKNQIKNADLFLIISLFSPVAIFKLSAGVPGAVFLIDIASLYLLFRKHSPFRNKPLIILAFILYLLWPIISTLISNILAAFSKAVISYDIKVGLIQTMRYFLYFILFAKLTSKPRLEPDYMIKLLRVASIMIFFIFIAILLGYFNIIKVDAWNELSKSEYRNTLGEGGMFLYRGGIGTLGAISIPIIYFCFIHGTRFYKYFTVSIILVIFSVVILSGSRQGVVFSFITFTLSILLFKQYKNALKIAFVGIILVSLLPKNETFYETSKWINIRYQLFFDKNTDLADEVRNRNTAINEAKKVNKPLLLKITGVGLGGHIHHTDSDYYDTYSYFGSIGIFFYILFVFYSGYKIIIRWKGASEIQTKQIFTISLILAIVGPLMGFQQWYIMTYTSTNAVNVYLILFFTSLAVSDESKYYY